MASPFCSVVECYEMPDSRQEGETFTGITASVQLRCAYANRYALMNDLVQNQRQWPFTIAPLRCTSAESVLGPSMQAQSGGHPYVYEAGSVIVSATYQSPSANPDQPDTGNVTENLEPTCEFITLDHKHFKWEGLGFGSVRKEEAPGQQQYGLNYCRTLSKVEPPLDNSILTLCGYVNDSSISSTSLGLTFATETLLYKPPTLSRTISATSESLAWNLALKFGYKPNGWNKFWHAKSQTWKRFQYLTGGDYNNYPLGDMSGFF